MGLKEYANKRHFDKTPEPGPKEHAAKAASQGGFFCVQRHDATRLHYDFRLEVSGVLVSWAVPKGPSLDPTRKALAMKVEDHPFDYGTFEGNIPKGNYGAGSVMLWDKGTYEVLGDASAQEQLDRGDFKIRLHGAKLNGDFAIVHMKHAGKGNEWLLIKKKDEFVVPGYDIDQYAWSVATKRTQDEIADDVEPVSVADLPGARKAGAPGNLEPMLATAVTKPPSGPQWIYEIKWDGVRALCLVKNGSLEIHSRTGKRCERQYPELHGLPEQVNAKTAWLDGEICVLDENGRGRFEMIQPRIGANAGAVPRLAETTPVTLFLFDVLYVDGYDLRGVPLEERKRLLQTIVTPGGAVRVSETFHTGGEEMFEAARQMGLEGILAKDRRSTYEGRRSNCWLKLKVLNEQEFVIGGFTKGERDYFGALVLGVQEGGKLRHAGQVGTGFDHKLMKAIYTRLERLVTKSSPFVDKPKVKDVTWVKPELVCQVRFLEKTQDGMLRAPVFVGLRDDKDPAEVVEEEAVEPTPAGSEDSGSAAPDEDLDLSGREVTVAIGGHRLKFTNLDKVLFPKDGWKKRDLLDYYNRVSPWLLPHLRDRPLSMKRYPNGIAAEYFFQKNATHFPDWLRCEPIVEHHPPKTNHYPLANDRASLLYLVNLGCIDQNPWMSRAGNLEHPDWMLLDLDPVEASFDQIVDAAVLVRDLLSELGLKGYPKTTGGDGMHVYVPLEAVYTYEQVRSFAEIVSHLALDREPNLFTTPRSVEKRKKSRVYFDYLQIGTGKTISAPYVVRAYDGAPVATPLDWKEVKHGLKPEDFRIDNTIERFRRVGDLFAPVLKGGQRLEDALERFQAMGQEPAPAAAVKKTSRRPKKA
ncbi:MAG TPA: DNA ligase D [Bryobacteraceae bacterium]|jgi:bifunctional non-homologous end joining protein LigD|nr:DNA ligase D [Bryobacteraceae bacterium]